MENIKLMEEKKEFYDWMRMKLVNVINDDETDETTANLLKNDKKIQENIK